LKRFTRKRLVINMKLKDLLEIGKRSRMKGLEREKKGIRPKLCDDIKVEIDKLSEYEKKVLLAMTMESIRGYWGFADDRIAIIFYLCDTIKTLPKPLLKAIKHNAYMFDGEFIDGRIFRDGDRLHGLSGNLAYYITGDDRIKQDGYYGTYEEVWKLVKRDEKVMRKVYEKVLSKTSDITWRDYFEEMVKGEK